MLEILNSLAKHIDIDPIGQIEWNVAGTYQWTVPDNVRSISAVAIGGGGSGAKFVSYSSGSGAGAGGCLSYKNNIPVVPGTIITVIVGIGGAVAGSNVGNVGGLSSLTYNSIVVLRAPGGAPGQYGGGGTGLGGTGSTSTAIGDVFFGGGNGGYGSSSRGTGNNPGGGGAGGYAGSGGAGRVAGYQNLGVFTAGTGGAAAGGGTNGIYPNGGGTGLRGQGSSGTTAGANGSMNNGGVACGRGGSVSQAGGVGGIRIIWGKNRSYPSTRTADE